MRLGYIKDENGNLVRKFIKEDDLGKDPNVLYHVSAEFGDYLWADEEHMDETKSALLEKMFDKIRNAAKIDKFWIVKTADDMWDDFQNSVLSQMHNLSKEEWFELQTQELKDGKCTVACKISLPQLEGYHEWEEAENIRKQLGECYAQW